MKHLSMLLFGAAALPLCLSAQVPGDSTAAHLERELQLNEVVVVANRPVLKHTPDRIVYLVKNDPYASGLDGIQILDRVPRISVVNDMVSVAGKSSVRYIIDGHLLEMPDEAIALRLKNLQASGIEKVELLTTPPAKYAAAQNVAYVSITTRNESLGTRGSVFGNGTFREDFSYLLGGNISHSTRKIELSADANLQNMKGINDLKRTYTFSDNVRMSDRSNHFTNKMLSANGLVKYKISRALSMGAIINFSSTKLRSNLWDTTLDGNAPLLSYNHSPGRPNNALTLTAFTDWQLDTKGKSLSLTYNFFNRHTHSCSDVTTWSGEDLQSRLVDYGTNKYRIHSAKLDAILPFASFKMESGASYTEINNNTALKTDEFVDENLPGNHLLSNTFAYSEKTAAAYVSAEKSFSNSIFGKLGLRYEHTDVKGTQHIGNMSHNDSYDYLFPTLVLSWNTQKIGRFSLSYSMGINRPNFNDLNPFRYYTTVTDYFSGNPDLQPSISHNAEINYSYEGIYAVIYNSYNHDAINTLTRFNSDGSQYSLPENCLNTNKIGLYASYSRSIFSWWNAKLGGEVFHTSAKSQISDFKEANDKGWSGKLELNTSWMLNSQKTLILNVRFSHYFPWKDRMTHYSSISLIGCDLRYSLLENRLNLSLSVNDPFGWNITKSKAYYKDYVINTRNNIHSHAVMLRASWAFGRSKVNQVYRDSKERESSRSY